MPAQAPSTPTPFTVAPAPGLRLRGESAGEGPAVVLLHGLTATRRYVVQGSRHLLSRGHRLVSYDARGHGESDPAPARGAYGYPDLVGDLEAVLDALELERAVLAGSSMGAATAAGFALARPDRVRALIQITPAHRGAGQLGSEALAHWDELADTLAAGEVDAFVAATGVDDLPERWRRPARLATRQRIERHRDLAAVADALRAVPRSAAFASLDRLDALSMPTLVVGSRDEADPGHPLAVAEEYARRLPRAELLVEDADSAPLAWRGARLSHAIGDFLDRVQE